MTGPGLLSDGFGRVMHDLRVSITDRCNFRCVYCLPETEQAANFYRQPLPAAPAPLPRPAWKPRSEILTLEEIERVVRLAVELGIRKVRVTGGEPLLRQGVETLVARLAAIPDLQDLAMTTNGFAFLQKAEALRAAGLRRVNFSLDSLHHETFKKMTGRDGLDLVLAGIRRARVLGFHPIKINAVVIRGLNDHELESLVAFAQSQALHLRFIEFMPLDAGRAWQRDLVVSAREIRDRLQAQFALQPAGREHPAATATRWRFAHGPGELGLIAPVTEPFCGRCNRLRLTADGRIRTCLFSVTEPDLRPWLRGGATDAAIQERLRQIVRGKEDRHHIGEPDFVPPPRTMSCIGG
ncbi:MAG: GTP 3',8-cyclase MoaA [Verrucomicrobia bacterium]|nr:GTP 3',8-cyclase MoaA [Verrucomicrobiota bacterium]